MDECIEDQYDARQTLLKSMIDEVGEERILELWKITDSWPVNKKHIHFVVVIDPVSYLYSWMSNISRGIICHHYFRVMMISAIAGFQIQMIPLWWYIDDQKSMDFATKTYFVSQEAMQNFLGVTLVPNPLTVPIAITDILYRAAKKKIRYGEVWGLAWQAAQLAVEHGSHGEIIGWLKQFINRHKEMITNTELV